MQPRHVWPSFASSRVEEVVSVVEAVVRDLADIAERDPRLAESSIAATALALASELDAKNSATSKSMCARALVETMGLLRELAPAEKRADRIDELAAKRDARRSG